MDNTNENPTVEGAKTFTQEEVDAIVSSRVEKLQKKYSDYSALKEKAAKYDQISVDGTELQKANERADKLQKQLDDIHRANSVKELRERVAKDTGVPAHLLTGEDDESCKAQAKAILEFARPSYPETDKNNYKEKAGASDDFRDLARSIFGGH